MKKSEDSLLFSPAAQLMAIDTITELLVSTSPHRLGEALTEHLRELSGARTVILMEHLTVPDKDRLLVVSPSRRSTLFSPAELNTFSYEESPWELPLFPEELPADHPLHPLLLRTGVRSMVRYPLHVGGALIGKMLLFDIPLPKRISETTLIFKRIAPAIALALKNALDYRQIEKQTQELEQRVVERTAELRSKNAELERFTYTVSHDLKSPLITIQAYVVMILRNIEAGKHERAKENLMAIEGAASQMTALLNDLLELSRAGKMMSQPAKIDMNRMLEDVLAQMAGPLGKQQIEMIVQPNLPSVSGDTQRLSAVIQNLIENAIKYMGDQAAPRIEIGTRNDGQETVFFVRDNGAGIDPRHHERIFGLFNKLDANSEGTGVGLALVKRIIEVHGGRVWVESEGEGLGSTFCFTVPGP